MLRNIILEAVLVMLLVVGGAAASTDASGFLPAQQELFQRALAQVGTADSDVSMDPHEISLYGIERYKLPIMDLLRANPWKTSAFSRLNSSHILGASASSSSLLSLVSSKFMARSAMRYGAGPVGEHRARVEKLGSDSLSTALAELTGRKEADFTSEESGYSKIPPAVRDAAALVLLASREALSYRNAALENPIRGMGRDPEDMCLIAWDYARDTTEASRAYASWAGEKEICSVLETLMDKADWACLDGGAGILCAAAQAAGDMVLKDSTALAGEYLYAAETPLGTVRISGAGDDTLPEGKYLLTMDTGGNDTYSACAGTADYAHPIGVSMDLSGDDIYRNSNAGIPAFGCGVFGYGILLDCSGNDSYDTPYGGEGCGIFGVGVLHDMAGDDTYNGFGNVQGSGAFGTGILADNAGDDKYSIYLHGQGYGYTMGCGVLVDSNGKDHYYANLVDNFNGGPYGENHHVHFVQGSGRGKRDDMGNGHSWSGGVGLLVDGGGDDLYEADCYGQGNAYWSAMGMLVDKGGNDVYNAGQYSLAGTPHFGIAVFQDEEGDDRYRVGIRQSLGHGRDWGLAWFEDVAGNDWYQASMDCYGASHPSSFSVFWDRAGDDVYIAEPRAGGVFGVSNPEAGHGFRDLLPTTAIFVDGGGKDLYLQLPSDGSYDGASNFTRVIQSPEGLTALSAFGNGKSWVQIPPSPTLPRFVGVGIDAD